MGREMGGRNRKKMREKMREEMRRKNEGGKKGKEGRRNTHSVGEHHRFYVTQTSPYIARALLLTAH